ncbi:arginine-ornithine antiporter [Pseudoleptotrichia goodfellowii]|uniref:Arginine-ornithine antiporter n=1 Tax=Pseudoleptotrichia goodfellowii F0264 TaxID=596323 RepID=D0GJ98_9FUSO|nr:arginine-ornithine antiporter [Pseudoleptotrichia goodfellowii]EEY35809.1 arginine/ornithine antiporter [Pseudoleptotrichia goodfellowii F0264]
MPNKQKRLGIFALTALVISSSLGSGIFGISSDMASSAGPGAALLAWVIVGFGVLMLCLSLTNLNEKRPDLSGIFSYAETGFGPFGGFISGWGYWLSSWLGNVAFATMMMSAVAYFVPAYGQGNNLISILSASVILWLMFYLVNRGVESAAILNAVITVCKLVPLVLFIVIAVISFKADVFSANFWGTVSGNFEFSQVFSQIQKSMMVLMWVFVGIEGAAMMSDRAEKKSIVGKSTILGLTGLLIVYILASILPYGLMTREELSKLGQPAMGYILQALVGTWGAALVNIALIISIFGCWLSWTMLPAETTLLMAKRNLLPKKFGELNEKKAPTFSLLFMTVLTQAFVFTLLFTDKAYSFAYSLCTAAIFVSWLFVTLYQVIYSYENKEWSQLFIGLFGSVFYLWAIWASGIGYFLLCLTVYILGIYLYAKARKENGISKVFSQKESIVIIFIVIGALLSIYMLFTGQIAV